MNQFCKEKPHVNHAGRELDITCPFMHPPAMMLGSEGLNLNEKISSGASSSAWQLNKIRNKSVWVPRLGSYGLLKPVSESTLHCFKEEHAKCLIQPWLWLMLINSGADLGRFKGRGAKWKKCNIITCWLSLSDNLDFWGYLGEDALKPPPGDHWTTFSTILYPHQFTSEDWAASRI